MPRVLKRPKLMILCDKFLRSFMYFLLQMPTGITSGWSTFIFNSEIF